MSNPSECPKCHQETLYTHYDDPAMGGMDWYECKNPDCRVRI